MQNKTVVFNQNGVLSHGHNGREVRGASTRMMGLMVAEDSEDMVARRGKEFDMT